MSGVAMGFHVGPQPCNPRGNCHGGIWATMADVVMQAIAIRFLDDGAHVVVSGRGKDGLDAFAADVSGGA